MSTLVELCCGTAAVSLWALARCRPLTGYMGSKRRDAGVLVRALGIDAPTRVVLVDGGPWGDVWATLQHLEGRRAVAATLREWSARGTLPEIWPTLLFEPPADAAERAAQYLCLQARAAGCIPVWWNGETGRWESPSGSRTEVAHQRNGCALETRMKQDVPGHGKRFAGPAWPMDGGKVGFAVMKPDAVSEGSRRPGAAHQRRPFNTVQSRGILRVATLAERVDALDRIDWTRVTVVHDDVGAVQPVPGSRVYFDPPYQGAPRYARLLPRTRVLEVAAAHGAVADLVVVSEAEPLPLDGWHSYRLRAAGKPEWLTTSRPLAQHPVAQLSLFGEAAA